MRTELKNYENAFWGQRVEDLKHTVRFVKSVYDIYWEKLRLPETATSTESNLLIDNHAVEANLLIQFGFWRLQGIFENLLKKTFDVVSQSGIRDIIRKIKKKGFRVLNEFELFAWADLRNDLTHQPTEWLNPEPLKLTIEDLEEYSELLISIYNDLERQQKDKSLIDSSCKNSNRSD